MLDAAEIGQAPWIQATLSFQMRNDATCRGLD